MLLARNLQVSFSSYLSPLYTRSIQQKTPFFTIPSTHIEILHDPLDFYLALNRGITYAYRRIGLSSLYIGTGSLERHLLRMMKQRHQALPDLRSVMVYDWHRSKREENGESPMEMLEQWKSSIIQEPIQNQPKIKIAYNRVGWGKGVFGQITGVHHQKMYIFDDRVIIGGANLSKNYFLNRKDRYYVIKNCTGLADYLFDYLSTLAQNCYSPDQTVDPQGNVKVKLKDRMKVKINRNETNLERHLKLWRYSHRPNTYHQTIAQQQQYLKNQAADRQKQQMRGIQIKQNAKKSKNTLPISRNDQIAKAIGTSIQVRKQIPQREKPKLKQQTRQRLFNVHNEEFVGNQLMEIEQPQDESYLAEVGQKVYIFPFMSIPQLKEIKQHPIFLQMLDLANTNKHDIRISSGYLNFDQETLKKLYQKDGGKIDVLCSAPQANSFFRGGMFKKFIPYFYRCFEHNLMTKCPPNRLTLKEYNNNEWSFHAKGLWIEQTPSSALTILGSSNYNDRSASRDSQLQLYMVSTCQKFNKKLDNEWKQMDKNCKTVTIDEIQKDPQIKSGFIWRGIAKIFKRFL